MKRHHWQLLALLLTLVLAVFAAGCGGDDDDEAGGATTAGEETTAEAVSGTVSVMAVWTGPEQASFQAVLDGFEEANPDVTVNYTSAGDQLPTQLSTAVEGGNPPDVAVLPQPGLMRDFAEKDALKPLDFAEQDVETNLGESAVVLGSVDDVLYGFLFKAANKSTVWYNVGAFEDAGVEPPETWEDFLAAAETVNASGLPAYSIGGADGWTLTDLFENIYLRTAGAEKYDQLSTHEIPWTDQSVKDALTEMAKIVGDGDNIVGGTAGALQTDFPTSVSNVFAATPKGAQVIEGDFVPGVVEHGLEPETDFNVFAFPPIGESGNVVVGGGDTVVMFEDSPAAQALDQVPDERRGSGDLGGAWRLRDAEPGRGRERLPRPDHRDNRRGARRGRGLPLRPLRPAAGGVRRHGRPGPVQAVPGLRREPRQHRRHHATDGDGRSGGVRLRR